MPAPSAEAIAERLAPLVAAPRRSALFADVDGTLAPIVERAELARVPHGVARLLGELGRRYGVVACVTGRSAADARRLVGVGSIAYAGSHGAEMLAPGERTSTFLPTLEGFRDEVTGFAEAQHRTELRPLGVRLEAKGPIVALHWRGTTDEAAAQARLVETASAAEDAGLKVHWGRKVLEIRPPVSIDKGRAVRELVEQTGARNALFGGDDFTDLDGFAALDALEEEGTLETAVRVGVRSDEGPPDIVDRADLAVEGTAGFAVVLEALAERA